MIPLANCDITAVERAIVSEEMQEGIISGTGRRVAEFEAIWRTVTDRKHAVAVANGTVALELALNAIGVRKGDEVIVPALTFAAPAAAVRRNGGTVVFADVDPVSWTIDVDHVRQLVNERTVAIIAVNVMGHPCDFEQLFSIANPRGIWIIEDAAESHGAEYEQRYAGAFGDISILSFHANKTITTGEGGMVLTDNDQIADLVKLKEVQSLYATTGSWDLIAICRVKDRAHLLEVISEFGKNPIVLKTSSQLVLHTYKNPSDFNPFETSTKK
jgi:perosamine synthetase